MRPPVSRVAAVMLAVAGLALGCESAPPGNVFAGGVDGGGSLDGGGATSHTVAGCPDSTLVGAIPTADAAIDDLVAAYSPDGAFDFVLDVLDRRYPVGAFLVEQGVAKGQQNCFDLFLPQQLRGTAKGTLDRIEVLVHECGHLYDLAMGGFVKAHYHIDEGVTRTCNGGNTQGSNKTVARSLINGDAYSAKRPPCSKGKGSHGCDSYGDVYLSGDPTDGKFESGDQGFSLLHEETVQYVHSLATQLAMVDRVVGSTSARDGILTFLWYTMRYLRLTRLEYPDAYKVIASDACWREAVLLTWGRAWRMLDASANDARLGIDDAKIMELVLVPELLAEIDLLRVAQGCK
jgi:hypothetical protein